MKIKRYKAILHCGGKTDEQLRERFGMPPSDEELALFRATMEAFDGMECHVVDAGFNDGSYAYDGRRNEAQADKEKEAVYLMEQDAMFGSYIYRRDEFEQDWQAGKYMCHGMWTFPADEVEILEEAGTPE